MTAGNETFATLQAEYAALQQENQRLREQVAEQNQRTVPDNALTESEQRYRLLIESMQDGVFLAQGGKLVFANEQLAAMVGYTAAELIQRSFIELIAPEDRDMVLDRHRRRTQGEAVDDHYEFRMLRRDGQRVWGNMIVTMVHYEGENATMGTVRNISAQKQQDEELRIFRFAVENISDGVHWVGPEGRYLYVNNAMCEHLGYTRDELLQMTVDQVDLHLDRDTWQQRIWPMVKEKGSVNLETEHRRKDGSIISIEISGSYMAFDDDEYLFAFARDISERKRQDEELRMFRFAIDNISDGVQLLRPDGSHRYANRALCEHLGYTRDELLQMTLDQVDPDIELEPWRQNLWPKIKEQGTVSFEARHRRKDDSIVPVEVTGNYMHFGSDEYLFAFARDISERKQSEERMRVLSALADNALDGVALASLDEVISYANEAFQRMSGYGEQCLGMPVVEFYPPESRGYIEQVILPTLMQQGSWQGVVEMLRPDGSRWLSQHSVFVIRSESGEIIYTGNILHDVTEQRRLEHEHADLQQQIIDAQRNALRELSTPLIPVSNDVVIMPLIGTIDSGRAQQVMETLLEGVARYQATLAILDITGVSVVDTQVAQALISAAQAVRLLGAQVMLTGIQPQIAQTLVHLGVDLSSIVTRGSLQAGIATALKGLHTRMAT